jgi:hypothetical protein
MNRLRDESGLDPISAQGIGILRAVRPTASPPGLRRRVWASLQWTSRASPAGATQRQIEDDPRPYLKAPAKITSAMFAGHDGRI